MVTKAHPPRIDRRRLLKFSALAGLQLPAGASAQADYPNRQVKIILPFTSGGLTDALIRLVAKELAARLGQPFVVDYRPGGSTNIAASALANAAPDGYTLMLANIAANALNKWTYKKLAYDPDTFGSVGMMGYLSSFLIVRPDSPFRSVQDLVRAAQESPTGLSYGSQGLGGSNHVVTELFKQKAGIRQLLHVPYKGVESQLDLMAGRIDFMFDSGSIVKVNAGSLRALAVTAPRRWPTQPDVPTMAEAGFPDVVMSTFYGLSAPPNTPAAVLDKLNSALRAITGTAEMQKAILALNVMPMSATRQEAADFIRQASDKWGPVLKSLNLSFD